MLGSQIDTSMRQPQHHDRAAAACSSELVTLPQPQCEPCTVGTLILTRGAVGLSEIMNVNLQHSAENAARGKWKASRLLSVILLTASHPTRTRAHRWCSPRQEGRAVGLPGHGDATEGMQPGLGLSTGCVTASAGNSEMTEGNTNPIFLKHVLHFSQDLGF